MFIGHLMMDISMVQTISLWELEMMILGNVEDWQRYYAGCRRSGILSKYMELLNKAIYDANEYRGPYNQLVYPSNPDPYVVASLLYAFYDVIRREDSRTKTMVAAIFVDTGCCQGAYLSYADGLYHIKNEFCPNISDYDFRFALSVLANRTDIPVR
ncbi:MAG: hypothetical protein IKG30_00430 [Clostridiales bacterium]|nr:hypothetical protein [Clostridiales bacterium]